MIRLALTAPSPALLAGLRHILSSETFLVTADAPRLEELETSLDDLDVLILGYEEDLEVLQGFYQAASLTTLPPVLFLGAQTPGMVEFIRKVSPVFGWLPLNAPPDEINAAVRALVEGLVVVHPGLLAEVFEAPEGETRTDRGQTGQDLQEDLTARELQVLQLLGEGLANKQIAYQLGISENTIKFHISSIYGKMGVNNRLEAVRAGVRQGLIAL